MPGSENNFIDGVYNYCDRWCEKCPLTARCRLFALNSDMQQNRSARRHGSGEGWEGAASSFIDHERELEELDDLSWMEDEDFEGDFDEDDLSGLYDCSDEELDEILDTEMMDESVREQFEEFISGEAELEPADFDEPEGSLEGDEEEDDDRFLSDALDRENPLVQAAHDYATAAHGWLNEFQPAAAASPGRSRQPNHAATMEACEVIRWYMFQIPVKLVRAVSSWRQAMEEAGWDLGNDWSELDEETAAEVELHQRDKDGSAKVALLGVERSFGAWTALRTALPEQDRAIRDFQRQLGMLRREIDESFPDARLFRRPGFDDAIESGL